MIVNSYDIAVVGLGAIGAATLMHLSKSGLKIVGIDQYSPPHDRGSSHGETRITRLSIGEGAEYVPLVKRSHELWKEIEAQTNIEILKISGGLIIDDIEGATQHGVTGFGKTTAQIAKDLKIPHEILTPKEARARFPEFKFIQNSFIYYEPGAGFVRPENAISAQLLLAKTSGADLRLNQVVENIEATDRNTVKIILKDHQIEAKKCLISAGSWVKKFVPDSAKNLFKITRQVLHWLPVCEGKYLSLNPIFIWCYGSSEEDMIYGFPSVDGKTIKVASESCIDIGDPEQIDRVISAQETKKFMSEKIIGRLDYIKGEPERSAVCHYTVTPNSKFIIGNHPEIPNVMVASCCSGHGFKHSAALGEGLAAKLLDEQSLIDLSPFFLRRL